MNIVSLLMVVVTQGWIVLGIRGIPPKKVKQVKAMIKKEEDTEAEAAKAALIQTEVPNPDEVRSPEEQAAVGVQELNYRPLLFGQLDPNGAAKCESADAEGDVSGNASMQTFIKKEPYLCIGHPIEQWIDGTDAHYGCKGSIAECARICNSHSSQCKAFVWSRSDSFRSNCYWQASPLAPYPTQWANHDCYIAKTVADTEPGKTLFIQVVEAREADEGPCKQMLEQLSVSDIQEMKPSDAFTDAVTRKCCSLVLQGKVAVVNVMNALTGVGVTLRAYCAMYNLQPSPATEPEGVEMQDMSHLRAISRRLGV